MLLLDSGIDLSRVWFGTWQDDTHTHLADLEISAELAQHYGFSINTPPHGLFREPLDLLTVLNNSFYPKLGLHRQMFFNQTSTPIPLLHIRGAGGEIIRKYEYETLEQLTADAKHKEAHMGASNGLSTGNARVLQRNKEYLEKFTGEQLDNPRFGHLVFKEAINKSHFGKWMVEDWLVNSITIAPAEDHELQRIANPLGCENLLYAVLLTRFRPELLEFPFDGNRAFDEETMRRARIINDTFKTDLCKSFDIETCAASLNLVLMPAYATEYDDACFANRIGSCIDSCPNPNPYDWCTAVFESAQIKEQFTKHYPSTLYEYALANASQHIWQPLEQLYASLAIAEISHLIERSEKG